MRYRWLATLGFLLCTAAPATADVRIAIGAPSLDIGIHLGGFPSLTVVAGSPVYYAPRVNANFFFYDGMYWVYQDDNWYCSSWYNGPWAAVDPEIVPGFLLRVPVRYYRRPPQYFRGWATKAPPRWGQHWGNSWEQNHSGWKHVKRGQVPAPAPIPYYQKRYRGDQYPQPEQQVVLRSKNYKYHPHEAVVQQHYQQQAAPQQHGQGQHDGQGNRGGQDGQGQHGGQDGQDQHRGQDGQGQHDGQGNGEDHGR